VVVVVVGGCVVALFIVVALAALWYLLFFVLLRCRLDMLWLPVLLLCSVCVSSKRCRCVFVAAVMVDVFVAVVVVVVVVEVSLCRLVVDMIDIGRDTSQRPNSKATMQLTGNRLVAWCCFPTCAN
jgi:hypothetical protein